jgi:hypothetical protein
MKKKVAILFYGLTRSLRKTYDNIKENIFDELTNNGFEYDTFIHTYQLDNPYINPFTGEKTYDYDNNSYQLLKPKEYIIQNQNLVEKNLRIHEYFSKLGDWAGCANTLDKKAEFVRNMVLALYSKNKVIELFSKYKYDYDYVIITRPDQKYNSKLNVLALNLLNENNIIIPFEHSYHGVNDRFCIARPKNAIIYGTSFNSLKNYSKVKSIISEVYLKDYLNFNKLNIIFGSLKAELVR